MAKSCSKAQSLGTGEIAAVLGPQEERKGFFSSRLPKVKLDSEGQVVALKRRASGCDVLRPDDGGNITWGDSELVLISGRSFDCRLKFPAVCSDTDGHAYDLAITARCTITLPKVFAERLGPGMLVRDGRLKGSAFAQLAAGTIQHHVRGKCASYSTEEIQSGNAYTLGNWKEYLSKWLGEFGCQWDVPTMPTLASVAAEAARIEQEEFHAEQERLARQKEKQEAELAAEQLQAEMEEQRRKIESDGIRSEAERKQQGFLLEKEYELKRIEAQEAVQRAQWRLDEAALEHQARMTELSGRRPAAQAHDRTLEELRDHNRRADERAQQQHNELQEMLTVLRQIVGDESRGGLNKVRQQLFDAFNQGRMTQIQAQQQFEQLRAMLEALQSSLANGGRLSGEFGYRLTSLLMSPDFGFSSAQVRALGFNTALQDLVAAVQAASAAGQVELNMRAIEYQTRDPFVCRRSAPSRKAQEVPVLRIGQPLNMELAAKRGGHVTLLNFGTSGTVWMMVPNLPCATKDSCIQDGQILAIPGSDLLPWNVRGQDIELRENGPVGREHMLLIVSQEPLLDEGASHRLANLEASHDSPLPFLGLSSAELEKIHDKLTQWDGSQWASAVLSFDVVPNS